MPEKTTPTAATDPPSPRRSEGAPQRVWLAVVIVVIQLSTILAASIFATSAISGAMGFTIGPLFGAIALTAWWLTARNVALRERILGLAAFAAALLWVAFARTPPDYYILMVGMPALSTVAVAILAATAGVGWRARRWWVVAGIVAGAGVFTGLEFQGVRGNLTPQLTWRWSTTSEDLLAISADQTPTRSGGVAELPAQIGPEDWPGFRGPNRDGRLQGVTFATDWTKAPPREIWRRPVGLGWSSFTVVGDYVFTQEQRGENDLVVCYSADTGEEIWINRITARFDDVMGSGPRATPTFHEGRLYTQGATGMVQCLDASTGETIWKRDLRSDTGAKTPTWGFSSSPLVVRDLAIVFSGAARGKSVVAYERSTGDVAWTAGDGSHGYSSGHLADIDGVSQALFSSNYGLQSFAPETGELLWEHEWDLKSNPRVVQPLVVDNRTVMAGTGNGKNARLLTVAKQEASWNVEEKWTSKRFRPYFNDFVYDDGHFYGFDGNRLSCVDAATGAVRWRGKRFGGQILLIADMEMLLALTESGDVALIEATPEGVNEVARIKALDSKTWNHPVVARGKLFVRNDQEAVCYELP